MTTVSTPASPAAWTSTLPNPAPSSPQPEPAPPPTSPDPDSDSDPLEIFSSSLFATFNHVVPWHGSPSSLYTFHPPPSSLPPPPPSTLPASTPLTIRIPPQAITSLHADAVWDASLLLANNICTGALDVRAKRVVELGAGAGLPSLMGARYGAGEVVLTDYDDPELVDNLERNRGCLGEEERGRLRVQGFCCELAMVFVGRVADRRGEGSTGGCPYHEVSAALPVPSLTKAIIFLSTAGGTPPAGPHLAPNA